MNYFRLSKLAAAVCLGATVVLGGCHKKVAAPPPAAQALPPAPASPTAQLSVSPAVITQGQSAVLTWTTNNANSAAIRGMGTVSTSGSQPVSPAESTTYTLTAKGAGGNVETTARLTVNPAPQPVAQSTLTEEQLFQQNVRDAYFDYDKYDLRSQDSTTAQEDASFLAKHPDMKVLIAGHCDERGSEEYNIALGQNRAQSLEHALETDGVAASRIRVVSYGKEKPFCTQENDQCWQENRRDHLTLDR